MDHATLNLRELIHYGELGSVPGLDPDVAKRIAELLPPPEPVNPSYEDLQVTIEDMNDAFDSIVELAKEAKA